MRELFGSIRARTVLLALLVAVAPLIFVFLGPVYGWLNRVWMRSGLRAAADTAKIVVGEPGPEVDSSVESRLADVADNADVWLRLLDSEGEVLFDAKDALGGEQFKLLLEDVAGGSTSRSHLEVYDEGRRPLHERRELLRARDEGVATSCELAQEGRLATCIRVERLGGDPPRYLYLQDASIRGVRELASARYPLLKLVLQVMGVGLVVALVFGWWSVKPIESLRDAVVDRAEPPVSTERLEVGARGEIGEVEEAVDELLEALEERRKATEAYMADIAHEVKNPVAAIRTAAQRLASGDLDDDRRERIGRVLEESTERLDQLVTRFLELARAKAGLPDERREIVAVDELAERLVEQFRADERFEGVEFESQIEAAQVEASSTHLETAIRNLLENAGSFAESRVELTLETNDGGVSLTVADDGPGIEPEDLPHVFDRFFSRRSGNEGTGLGLAMTRAVVEAHDGSIDVDSEVGEGTSFRIDLDAAEQA